MHISSFFKRVRTQNPIDSSQRTLAGILAEEREQRQRRQRQGRLSSNNKTSCHFNYAHCSFSHSGVLPPTFAIVGYATGWREDASLCHKWFCCRLERDAELCHNYSYTIVGHDRCRILP